MDASALPDLAALLQNPAAMSLLSAMLSSQQKSDSQEKSAPSGGDTLSKLMSALGGLSAPPSGEKSSIGETRNQKNGDSLPFSLGVFGTKEEIKNRIALLGAVRPYLSEARRERLETVIKLLRLAELGTLSNLLSGN